MSEVPKDPAAVSCSNRRAHHKSPAKNARMSLWSPRPKLLQSKRRACLPAALHPRSAILYTCSGTIPRGNWADTTTWRGQPCRAQTRVRRPRRTAVRPRKTFAKNQEWDSLPTPTPHGNSWSWVQRAEGAAAKAHNRLPSSDSLHFSTRLQDFLRTSAKTTRTHGGVLAL